MTFDPAPNGVTAPMPPFFQINGRTLMSIIQMQTEIATSNLDLAAILDLVCHRTQVITRSAGAVVEMLEGQEMVYWAASGSCCHQLGLRLNAHTSLSGHCVRTNRAMKCDDAELDSRVDREACRKVGLRSMVVTPLTHKGDAIGVLKVMSSAPSAFEEEDIFTLALVSDFIAATMYRVTAYEQQAKQAEQLFHLATHDSLTGLANRALFYDRARQALASAKREDAHVAIIFLDMDGLKRINDVEGHKFGDAALKELGQRVKNISREVDTVARLGGDEFAVLLYQIETRADAGVWIARWENAVAAPFTYQDKSLGLAASVGCAIFPDDAQTLEALVECADKQMYASKRERKLHIHGSVGGKGGSARVGNGTGIPTSQRSLPAS